MQTKDVPTEPILETIRNAKPWATTQQVFDAIPDVPKKLVLSKLASMIRRKVITGCACGCRGEFQIK